MDTRTLDKVVRSGRSCEEDELVVSIKEPGGQNAPRKGRGREREGCREVNYWDRELGSTAERGMPRWTMIQWNECVILSKGVSTYSDSLEVALRRLVLSRERDGSLSVYNVFRIMAGLLNYLFFSFFTHIFVLFLFSLGIRGSVIFSTSRGSFFSFECSS